MLARRLSVLVLPILWAAAPAAAQDVPPTGPTLSWSEALDLAVGRNLALAQSRTDAALADVDLAEDRAQFGPTASVSGGPGLGYQRFATRDAAGALAGTSGDVSATVGVSVGAGLTLYDAGRRRAAIARSQAAADAARATLSRAEEDALFLTATQYLAILQAQAVVAVEAAALAAQQEQLAVIEAFYDAGARSLADVLQQRATIAQRRLALVSAEREEAAARLRLRQTLALPALARVAPVDTAAALPRPDTAAVRRADVEAQRLRVAAAQAALRVARTASAPTVALDASAATDASDEAGGVATQLFTSRPGATVRASVSLPLLDRRAARSAAERAQIGIDAARLALAQTQQQVATDVAQAALDVDATAARLAAAEAQATAAAEALDAARERYRVGAGTFAELADAQRLDADARGALAQARYQVLIDRVALGYATGRLLPVLDALRSP